MVQNHSQILRLSTCRVSIVQGRRFFSTGRCGRSPQVRAQVRSSCQVTGLSRWGKPKPSKILHICIYIGDTYIYILVGGIPTPLKNMKVKWGGLSHMGVVQNYGTRKLPLRRAFANLSRPFAPQQNRDMGL